MAVFRMYRTGYVRDLSAPETARPMGNAGIALPLSDGGSATLLESQPSSQFAVRISSSQRNLTNSEELKRELFHLIFATSTPKRSECCCDVLA